MSDHWYSLLSPGTWLSGMASVLTSTQVLSNGFYNQAYSNAKSTLRWYWFSRGVEVECNKEMDRRPELGCSPYGFILIRDPLGFRKDSAIPKNVSANSTWWEKIQNLWLEQIESLGVTHTVSSASIYDEGTVGRVGSIFARCTSPATSAIRRSDPFQGPKEMVWNDKGRLWYCIRKLKDESRLWCLFTDPRLMALLQISWICWSEALPLPSERNIKTGVLCIKLDFLICNRFTTKVILPIGGPISFHYGMRAPYCTSEVCVTTWLVRQHCVQQLTRRAGAIVLDQQRGITVEGNDTVRISLHCYIRLHTFLIWCAGSPECVKRRIDCPKTMVMPPGKSQSRRCALQR